MREIARDIYRNGKEEIEGDAKSGVRPGDARKKVPTRAAERSR